MELLALDLPSVSWETATFVDAAVILVALLSAGLGFWTGFVWQIIRLFTWIAAIWLAGLYNVMVAGWLGEMLTPEIRAFLGFLAVFLVVLVIGHLIGHLARSIIEALNVTFTDRILGAILGGAKGLLLCGALAVAILTYLPADSPVHEVTGASQLATYCAKLTALIWVLLPGPDSP